MQSNEQWKAWDSHNWKGLVETFKKKGATEEELCKFCNFLWHHYTFHKLKPSGARKIIIALYRGKTQ